MPDIKLVNCTPHPITIITGGQNIHIPRSPNVARCNENRSELTNINGIPIYATRFSQVENLPSPAEDTFYIVSSVVAKVATERNDLLMPDSLVRGSKGEILGCQGLSKPR